jgi:DNA-3-methyladenine glycosylase I
MTTPIYPSNKERCPWCLSDPLYVTYHDQEWGKPLYDNQKLFEFVLLEGMQAGLNWLTILKKREAMRLAFHQFNPEKLATMSDKELVILQNNPNIIRHRLKIASTRKNAQAFLNFRDNNEDFSQWLWQFTEGKPLRNTWKTHQEIPAETDLSKNMAKALKARGFCFVGPTTCYALMQATGMVNDHLVSCYRYDELS